MTRSEANDLIRSLLTMEQLDEFEYQVKSRQIGIDDELEAFGETELAPADFVEVLIDLHDKATGVAYYSECPQDKKQARASVKAYDRLLLKIGYYRPATQQEIDNTYSMSSGRTLRKATFQKIDGVKVTQDRSFSVFLEWFQ